MPIEGIPEKDWTPCQREQVRHWQRLWTRDDQWLRIEKRKIRQQHAPDWICLADIADWCARRPADIERDPRRRMQAYCDLQESILLGEFSKGGRLKVIYLAPQPPSLRDRVRLRLNAGYLRAQCGSELGHVLDLCWAPRELCLRWLVARHIDPPPWLAAEPIRIQTAQVHEASKPGAAAAADRLKLCSADVTRVLIEGRTGQQAGTPTRPEQKSQPLGERTKPALEGAKKALCAAYGNAIPDQATEPNATLCCRVGKKLKELKLPSVSDTTILRAAGRRRDQRGRSRHG